MIFKWFLLKVIRMCVVYADTDKYRLRQIHVSYLIPLEQIPENIADVVFLILLMLPSLVIWYRSDVPL